VLGISGRATAPENARLANSRMSINRNRQRDLSSAEERQRRGADNTDHRDVDAKKPVGGTFLDGSHGPA
jgi:hypothetical protein